MTAKTIAQLRLQSPVGACDDGNRSEDHVSLALEEYSTSLEAGQPLSRESLLAKYSEVADELNGCLDSLEFIRQVAPQLSDESSDIGHVTRAELSSRASLGDFRILREIGRGGMGVVYEAEQLSIGRRVALKVLPFAAMLDKQQLNRFKNEARAAGTLDHPNIVAIHSVGVERGVHYYAMQLIEGQSLAQIIAEMKPGRPPSDKATSLLIAPIKDPAADDTAKAALPTVQDRGSAALSNIPSFDSREYFRTIARLGIQAAEALDHAHQNGILHRDIKPANLLLDDAGKLWITDFGLARIEQDAGMTMTGDLLGTMRYMSPEQALAKRVVIDHRSDIYSLGVTLYELLTLQPTYTGDDRQELLRQIAFEEPRKPRQINPRIPQDLETIVLKAIEKNPVDRYVTAQELADDLRRFSENRSIHARQPTVLQRVRKLARRHRTASIVIAAAALLCVMIATAYLADRRRQIQDTNHFVELSLQAARTALESGSVNEAVRRMSEAQARIDAIQLVDPVLGEEVAALKSELGRYAKFLRLYKTARDHRSTGDEKAIKAIAAAHEALALYRVMEEPTWFQALQQSRLPQSHVDRLGDGVYELLLLIADDLVRWSSTGPKATREARRQAQCRDALEYLDKAIAFHQPSSGYYWLLANCSLIMGDKDKEKRLRTTALETTPHDAAELFYINRDRVWGTMSKNRGYPEYTIEENYKDHREMLRLDPTYYNGLFFMGFRSLREGRHDEALMAWYACVALRPTDWVAIFNRGCTHAQLGHADEAKADYELVLSAQPNNPKALGYIARSFATDPIEATRDGIRAVQLATKACKLTDYKDPEKIDALALGYAETGDFDSAIKWSEMAVKLSDNYLQAEYKQHLESFRQGKPWREE